jgi:hypothetical protein
MYKKLKQIEHLLNTVNESIIDKSMNDCHVNGLFRLTLSDKNSDTTINAYITEKEIYPYDISLRTYRHGFNITTLTSGIKHHVAKVVKGPINGESVYINKFKYQNPLNGGRGIEFYGGVDLSITGYDAPTLTRLQLNSSHIHSLSCRAGSIWLAEETINPDDELYSFVYGSPFATEGLYNTPNGDQILNRWQTVKAVVKKHLADMRLVD